ncbi:MAG: UDP-glucose/GDP-mannose dehydrogenase family protein [Methanocellales archaeon]
MKISIIGTGYVGLVTAVCLAELGNEVICLDVDEKKVEMINQAKPPIYEVGLKELLEKHVGKNLHATTSYAFALTNSGISFICIGTPQTQTGGIDLTLIKEASVNIGKALKQKKDYHIIVMKSTVLPLTSEEIVIPLIEKHSFKEVSKHFGYAVNPEFLREGRAINDFMNPDKIVIGTMDEKTKREVTKLYENFKCPIINTDLKTAEMIKYANNAFLATKISFSNEIGNICKQLDIDTYEVMRAIGYDYRINPYFLNAGLGYGGSCLPKDLNALINKAREIGYEPRLLEAVSKINEEQPLRMINLLERKLEIKNRKIAILGLAFKNDTDDIRESRAIPIIKMLIERGARISAYDPRANENMRKLYPDIEYCNSARDALKGAEACLILTEWEEFSRLDEEFEVMKNKLVIDGRRILNPRNLKIKIEYEGLCW